MITGNGSTEEEAKLDHDVKLNCLLICVYVDTIFLLTEVVNVQMHLLSL